MKIEILHASNKIQTAKIDGKNYEFNFTENELSESIEKNCFELTERSDLNCDYSVSDKAEYLACDWEHSDVEQLISDFITENPANLIDHLIEGADPFNNPEGPITIKLK